MVEITENIPDFIPLGNHVLLRLEKVKQTSEIRNGIVIPNAKEKYSAIIHSKGSDAQGGFEVGDNVVFNEYDKKVIERNGITYVLIRDENIWAIVPEKETTTLKTQMATA